jgi:uncharacterized protein YggE
MRATRPTKLASGICLVALAAVVAVPAAFAQVVQPQATRGITVSGSGRVSVVPNRADLSFGVTTQAKTASIAMRDNATAMTKVINALKAAGVDPADIQTQFVSLMPRTNENGDLIVGYTATNSVGVTVRNLAAVGTVIDAAVAAGANTVSGPDLTRSDANALYRAALRGAIADARTKAQLIASASGVRLGRVVSVVEGSTSPLPVDAKTATAPATTPIEPGTQYVTASVTVTFAVR